MKLKKEKTPEEIAKRKADTKFRRTLKSLSTKIKNECSSYGLRVVELKYEWLKSHPTTLLPVKEIDYQKTCDCFLQAIDEYKLKL